MEVKNATELEAFGLAQDALSTMKQAIVMLLNEHEDGLQNAQIGRLLGTNGDFLEDQTGWFQWTVLKMLELESVVEQSEKRGPWKLKEI